MPHVEESIEIAAPVEKVFDLIANQPERMVDWWPPIDLQERVTPPPTNTGSISRYVYNMMGIKIKGEHKVVAMTLNQHLSVKTISGIDSAFHFTFSPSTIGTTLNVRVDYKLPGSIMGQLINRLAFENKNVEDLQQGLRNLKTMLESEARV